MMKTVFRSLGVAALVLSASVPAHAASSTFSWDPAAAGLAGAAFTADNLLLSDYLTVTNTSASTFSEAGLLSITGAQLNGSVAATSGLNSSYGLYIAFSGTGVTSGGNPLTSVTTGSFTSLTFTLYGYNGTAAFGFAGTTPTTTAASPIALASGSLVNGSVVTLPTGGSFAPSSTATVSLDSIIAASFFSSPSPFYSLAQMSFTNTSSQVELFANGFMIGNGGGTANFASPVPEPSTQLMLLAGVGAIGWVASRRRRAAA